MVTAHELLVAFSALESLFAGVGSAMALKFVRSREAFATEEPRADKGTLASVPSQMGSQVRCFAVDFVAARYVADVLFLAVRVLFTFLAIGTCACNAFKSWLCFT